MDAEDIIQEVLKNSKTINGKDAIILAHSTVTNQLFIKKMESIFDPMVQEKADEVQYSSMVGKMNMEASNHYVLFLGG